MIFSNPDSSPLAYFDKYKYGQLNADIENENIEDLKAKQKLASECWKKAQSYNPAINRYGAYGSGVEWAAEVIRKAQDPKREDFRKRYAKDAAAAREQAMKDVAFDQAKGDLLYVPTDMTGPDMFVYKHPMIKETRFVKAIRGSDTGKSEISFTFECDPFPPPGDYKLFLYGMDDEVRGKCTMEILVNDTVVFSGDPDFPEKEYRLREFKIPFASMKRNNRLTIRNTKYGSNAKGPPYICLAYAVLKKSAQ